MILVSTFKKKKRAQDRFQEDTDKLNGNTPQICKGQPRMTRRKWVRVFTKNLSTWLRISPDPHLKPTLLLTKGKNKPCLRYCGFCKLLGYQYIYPQAQTFGSGTAHSALTWGEIMGIQSTWGPEGTLKSARELIIAWRCHSWSFSSHFARVSYFRC